MKLGQKFWQCGIVGHLYEVSIIASFYATTNYRQFKCCCCRLCHYFSDHVLVSFSCVSCENINSSSRKHWQGSSIFYKSDPHSCVLWWLRTFLMTDVLQSVGGRWWLATFVVKSFHFYEVAQLDHNHAVCAQCHLPRFVPVLFFRYYSAYLVFSIWNMYADSHYFWSRLTFCDLTPGMFPHHLARHPLIDFSLPWPMVRSPHSPSVSH
jgi:hypothetical protein